MILGKCQPTSRSIFGRNSKQNDNKKKETKINPELYYKVRDTNNKVSTLSTSIVVILINFKR